MNQRTSLLWSIGILSAVLLATLVLLSSAAQTQFSERFSLLLAVNAVGLVTLLVLILANLRRLWIAVRRNVPGARLELRVLRMLVLLAILPLLVVYGFSLDFLRRGIDSWFDVRIEAALSDSLELSRSALDRRMREALKLTEQAAFELGRGAPRAASRLDLSALREPDSTVVDNLLGNSAPQLDGYRDQIGADEMALLERNGNLLSASSTAADIVPRLPSRAVMLQLRGGQSYIGLEPVGDGALAIRVAVNIVSERIGAGGPVLHALFPIDSRTNRLAGRVEDAVSAYNELTYLRDKLKLSFVMTLTLVLLFSMFAAVWGALYVASRLADPIRDLVSGTRAVAAGDYATSLPIPSRDDLGMLVSSFNQMTLRIAEARDQIEDQRTYLEALLRQLSSGVITLDQDRRVTSVNHSAARILGCETSDLMQRTLSEIKAAVRPLRGFVDDILPRLSQAHEEGHDDWHEQITLFGGSGRQVLLCHGTAMQSEDAGDHSYVIVMDDITALIQGQRDAAWAEVARRLAHEIKNPLTPIQLSAERLRRKCLPELQGETAETIDRLTNTIIQQVDSMKAMVNTFSDFARPAKLQQESLQLNELLESAVDLYRGVRNVSFELSLFDGLPPVRADANRLRQVFNNLIQNALDAIPEEAGPEIRASTNIFSDGRINYVEIVIADNGEGIAPDFAGNVFEPYVTSKNTGSGLGLAIVKKIVEEHGGVVELTNNPEGGGARATIRLPIEQSDSETGVANLERNAV